VSVSSSAPDSPPPRATLTDWFDAQAGAVFLMPAVIAILLFSIFPLLVSAWLAVSRFKLAAGGYAVDFVGGLNFKKMLYGTQQAHLIGTVNDAGPGSWLIFAALAVLLFFGLKRATRSATLAAPMALGSFVAGAALAPFGPLAGAADSLIEAIGYWQALPLAALAFFVLLWALTRRLAPGGASLYGFLGLMLAGTVYCVCAFIFLASAGDGIKLGSLTTTLIYVLGGVCVQFAIGLGLALICAQQIRGRNFFRVVFFIPLMVTPIGIAYAFRMMADTNVGPFAPVFNYLGLGAVPWATNPWAARLVITLGESWQWIPFIFIVMLAAVEGQPRDQVEAAELDGASSFAIFRDITWPSIAPVAATITLIRLIEAFKIVDLPNVLTAGGPGFATESLTLHAFTEWRALNLGQSAAVAYTLLFVSTITAVSFFNFVVRPARGEKA
jgi:ABC-type sugar transport system permease subunit